MKITEELVDKVRDWLGEEGIDFFKHCLEEHGDISPVYMDGNIPHPVHFREGMSVRNFMRSTGLCDDWNDCDLDDNWAKVVEEAIFSVKIFTLEEKNAKKKEPNREQN